MYPYPYINREDSVHLVHYNLWNMRILFQYMPCHRTDMSLTGLDLLQYMAWFRREPNTFWNNAVLVVDFDIFCNWIPHFLCLFYILELGYLDWQMSFQKLFLSICLIISIKSISKFPRNFALIFESFIRLSILVTSTSVSPAQSVITSRTMPILGFGAAVKSLLFGTISSRNDAKSINGSGFLSHLSNGLKFFFGLATRDFSFYHAVKNLSNLSCSIKV